MTLLQEVVSGLADQVRAEVQKVGLDQRLLLMHQVMLGDLERLEAYDRALEQAIERGDTVVDVGAGTLILSFLALRRGAGHVYAIEADPQMAELAAKVVADNGLEDRLTIMRGDARTVLLPRRADVLVSEMMGNLGPEEEMAEILEVVARRLLRPGGRIIPQRLTTKLQAIAFANEGWGVWRKDFLGFSLAAVRQYALPGAQLHFFSRPPALLSEPIVVADNVLGQKSRQPGGRHRLEVTESGTVHAIIMYFCATLCPGIELSNFPSYPGCNWAVWVWPIQHADVARGNILQVDIERPATIRFVTEWRLDCRIARNTKP
ncbi:methyltransferase domain-containing protein [Bradyrhizobium sp. AUGA SZCCT0431]|uniref:methyltransferase domain-containing protein n=1 Tax=Bradyrhizobium sp. AUGA SZCCT0431 TaxID=2807674 RepID=UPI001BAC3091|nr:50S ribosomal protein L11 methyltransferase [Bradyrhizobium sp. AUGA SZCCT0431]MBR1147532.1 50S ribosomal protein L11 methyltransferase [Bradyrhizobium sp. AUGA SZCCT0431]